MFYDPRTRIWRPQRIYPKPRFIRSSGCMGIPTTPQAGTFPGQPGNPVGFAATPSVAPPGWSSPGNSWPGAYPGSLTTWPGGASPNPFSAGTASAHTLYSFFDFPFGPPNLTEQYVDFVGCRFQGSGASGGIFTITTGAGNNLGVYCSFVPLVSNVTTPTDPGAWPSGGAGLGLATGDAGYTTHTIPYLSGYEFAINYGGTASSIGPTTWGWCDAWGFADCISYIETTSQQTFNDWWMHDTRNDNSNTDHTDGPGYTLGDSINQTGNPPNNVLFKHCTIAAFGNTNAIAFQYAAANYIAIQLRQNYLGGFGVMMTLGGIFNGHTTSISNCELTDNTFGTAMKWGTGAVRNDISAQWVAGSGGLWRRNKLLVENPATYVNWGSGASPSWTNGDSGKYIWPDNTLNSTDWPN